MSVQFVASLLPPKSACLVCRIKLHRAAEILIHHLHPLISLAHVLSAVVAALVLFTFSGSISAFARPFHRKLCSSYATLVCSALTSMYCGAIIVGLFISSCYWYMDVVPVSLSTSRFPLNYAPVSKMAKWLFYQPSNTIPPVTVQNSSLCATCWVDLRFSKNSTLLGAMQRVLPNGSLLQSLPHTMFLGIPGSQLGMMLEFKI